MRTEINKSSKTLDIFQDSSDKPLQFPFLWLRDNCRCERCFCPRSSGRKFLMRNLKTDMQITEAQVKSSTGQRSTDKKGKSNVKVEGPDIVKVTWSDGHQGSYVYAWLEDRQFTQTGRERRSLDFMRRPKLWNYELQEKVTRIDFNDLMSSDRTLYEWINELETIGINIIRGAPQTEGVLHQIGDRVAYLRRTNYGQIFTVKAKQDASNLAFTNATLGLHCDTPNLKYAPGMQMLHFLKQVPTKGGENTFTDGFYVAGLLKRDYPGHFHLLSSILLNYWDRSTDTLKVHCMNRAPVFTLDANGDVEKIVYNNQKRDSLLDAPLELVDPLYRAIIKWEELINDPKHTIKFKMQEGDVVCFHNNRVLHGREGYTMIEGAERHLEGGYIDWDEMRSRRRVLEDELGLRHYLS